MNNDDNKYLNNKEFLKNENINLIKPQKINNNQNNLNFNFNNLDAFNKNEKTDLNNININNNLLFQNNNEASNMNPLNKNMINNNKNNSFNFNNSNNFDIKQNFDFNKIFNNNIEIPSFHQTNKYNENSNSLNYSLNEIFIIEKESENNELNINQIGLNEDNPYDYI